MLDLPDLAAYQEFISSSTTTNNSHALVMHTATWCGPCKAAKPAYEHLSQTWAAEAGGLAALPIVCATAFEDKVDAAECGISAYPTFVLWDVSKKQKIGEVKGGDLHSLQKLVEGHLTRPALAGETMGGSKLSKDEDRAKMLERLGGPTPTSPSPMEIDNPAPPNPPASSSPSTTTTTTTTMEDDDDDPVFATPNNEPVWDESVLETLTQGMGFSDLRAKKGLMNGNYTTEGAIDWLMNHQDDADIDAPIDFSAKPAAVAQSYKCNECGKLFSSMASLELHANKTGHSDFSESTEAIKPLTEEEKAAKMVEITALLKKKKGEVSEWSAGGVVEDENMSLLLPN